jgi:LPXTG-site transpeptidase (sortase) family protein
MQRLLGNALIALGAVAVALGVGTVAYADWAERQHAARSPAGPIEILPSRVDLAARRATLATSTPAATPWPTAALPPPTLAARPPRPTPEPTLRASARRAPVLVPNVPSRAPSRVVMVPKAPSPTVAPTPSPAYGPAVWMTIPKLQVAEKIMDVGIENGEYVVPAWDIGHHQDSVQPGEPGNAVFNGHLETINAGRVFARLKDLAPGDAIYTYTSTERLTWVVRETRTVGHKATDFFAPTDDTRITLYTCTGTWLPLELDYAQRLVVVGDLADVAPRQ